MTAFSTEGQSDPTVQPVPTAVVRQVDAADVTLSNPKMAVISLGSNLGNRLETLQGAVDALEDTPGLRVEGLPGGRVDGGVEADSQAAGLDAVIGAKTALAARVPAGARPGRRGGLRPVPRGALGRGAPRCLDIVSTPTTSPRPGCRALPHPRAQEGLRRRRLERMDRPRRRCRTA
ncbi:2-amino-4-hydroxy-6-hydroxymethyldihydropteridinediphosphokinase [Streptomyces badius]